MQSDLVDLDLTPPQNLGDEQYEGVALVLLHNVEQGIADPLLGLSEQTELELRALAFNDTMRLERLERRIRDAMAKANYPAGDVKRFNLKTYSRAAKELRDKIAAELSRIQKMAARNMRVIDGGKADPGLERVEGMAASDAADVYSSSARLQAIGWLKTNRKGRIWYDEFYNDFFSDWTGDLDDRVIEPRRIDEQFLNRLHATLLRSDNRLAKSSDTNSTRALHTVAAEDRRNEPREWLTSLKWDNTERLETWLRNVYGVPDDSRGYYAAVGRCWFVSMVARIMDPGCKVDTMPVLGGPEGTAKSSSLEIIGGKWYATLNVSADKMQDFLGALAGLLVAEIAELDAISNRKVEITRVKTLLSTRVDRYRPPYGRTTQEFKRTTVLVGTTNEMGWHRDDNGGRRFWPIECERSINLEWLRQHREQLWAEALVRYQRNEKWWDVPEDAQRERIQEHYVGDPWQDRIGLWLRRQDIYRGPGCGVEPLIGDPNEAEERAHWGTLITTSRVAVQVLQLPVERQSRVTQVRVAQAMKSLGWASKSVRTKNGGFERAWIVTGLPGAQIDANGQKSLDLSASESGAHEVTA